MTTINSAGVITHVKGDQFYLLYTDVKLDGVVFDWDGYTGVLNIKETKSGSIVKLYNLDLSVNGQITIDGNDEGLTTRTYYYDMVFTSNAKKDTWFNNLHLKVVE